MPGVLEKMVGFGDEFEGAFGEAARVRAEPVDGLLGQAVDLGVVAVAIGLGPGSEGGEHVVAVGKNCAVGIDSHL